MLMSSKSSNLRKRSKNTVAWSLLAIVCLLPLLFINIRDSHDWGDDFAMYLMEAQNINAHSPVGETGFMTNPNAMMGPQAYPVGYPLLLAPIIKMYGLNFKVLNLFQSGLFLCTLFLGFLFLRRYFTALSALLMTLVIAYNPVCLNFKTEIISDIPFWLLLNTVLCLVYYNRYSSLWLLLTGVIIAFSIHIRSIGFALLLAFVLYRVINDMRTANTTAYLKTYLWFIFGFAAMYITVKLSFPVDSSYTYFEGDLLTTSANHLSYNLESISNFFKSPGLNDYYFITTLCAGAFLTFTLLGFVQELRNHPFSFITLLTVLFFGVVVFYHLGDAGIRLILPLMFVFFYYFATGFKWVFTAVQLNYKVTAFIACFLLLLTYISPLQKIASAASDTQEGPSTRDSKDVFNYMNAQRIVNKNIGFDRPRALALFTGNKSVHLSDSYLPEEVTNYKLDYILVHELETSQAKKNFIHGDTLHFSKVFGNGMYELFKTK